MANLRTAPLIGPVTASAFVACVDDPKRFKGPHQVEAYVGLVPSEMSSGEKQRKGRITKTGNARVRWLLVTLRAVAPKGFRWKGERGSFLVRQYDGRRIDGAPIPRIPHCAGEQSLATFEREQKDDEPRGASQ